MRLSLVLALLVATGTGTCAEDGAGAGPKGPSTPEQVAEAVVAGLRASDVSAMEALARRDDPDPWLVADELIRRREHDAALSFAKAAPRIAVEGLAHYVSSRRAVAADDAVRAAVSNVNAALVAETWQRALDAAGDSRQDEGEATIPSLRLGHGRGMALRKLGQLDAASATLNTVARGALKLGWRTRASAALHDAAEAAYAGGRPAEALAAWQARLALLTELGDRHRAAQARVDVGIAHFSLGDYAAALASFERGLATLRELGDRAKAARAVLNIGNAWRARGDYARALASYREARAAFQDLGDGKLATRSLSAIATVERSLGQLEAALESHRRALAEQEASGDSVGASETWFGIGLVHLARSDFRAALPCVERRLRERRTSGDRIAAANALAALGAVRSGMGDFRGALAAYEEALAAQRELGDRAGAASTLGNLGSLFVRIGDFDRALTALERSLREKHALGDVPGVATLLGALGNLHHARGHHETAMESFREALDAHRATGDGTAAAQVLVNVALAHFELGRTQEAIDAGEQAIRELREIGDLPSAARALVNLGKLLRRRDESRSVACYEQALAMLDRSPDPHARASALWGLAAARLAAGEPVAAVRLARDGVRLVSGLAAGLAETEGAAMRDTYEGLFDVGAAAALASGDTTALAWFLEEGRAASLREGLGARGALESAILPDALRADLARAREAERQAAEQLRRSSSTGDRVAARASLARWTSAQGDLEAVASRAERTAKTAAAMTFGVVDDLDSIRARLESDEALVLYALTARDALALVVRRDGTRAVRLAPSADVAKAAAAFIGGDHESIVPGAARPLRSLITDPLALGDDVRRVLVSPAGVLGYVPFGLLLPNKDVAFVPSATTLRILRDGPRGGRHILALGDPSYGPAADGSGSLRSGPLVGPLSALPATRLEAESIGTTTLLGRDATEGSLGAALCREARWRAVHFACHGFVDAEHPARSALAITPSADDDGFLSALEIARLQVHADLVVLSACETARGRIFRTEGIVGLTSAFMLAGAPRVVCSLWKVDDEATRLLMTRFYALWNPKDGSKPLGAAAALRAAQAYVRELAREVVDVSASQAAGREVRVTTTPFAHPSYWAAWVLWGLGD